MRNVQPLGALHFVGRFGQLRQRLDLGLPWLFQLQRIIPADCTGRRAMHALADIYRDPVLTPAAVGRQFLF
ncbi:MAG: hypothetical protein OEP48_13955 [Betaproteobacteria bacterium]|nr:hypothetical protein [Betaproteobacteria bacterium]